ncbi:DUF1127 domain-containing protein [Escherichia coli]|nr:DUF1127 domain-containing protein [Escherichia coli]
MEFHENKAKAPFIGLVQLWQAVRRWRRQMQVRRVLQQMSDERCGCVGAHPHRAKYLDISSVNMGEVQLKIENNKSVTGKIWKRN